MPGSGGSPTWRLGGKSIIAARSTAAKGKVSRIVTRLDRPVTTPRIDTHYVVTEYELTKAAKALHLT